MHGLTITLYYRHNVVFVVVFPPTSLKEIISRSTALRLRMKCMSVSVSQRKCKVLHNSSLSDFFSAWLHSSKVDGV